MCERYCAFAKFGCFCVFVDAETEYWCESDSEIEQDLNPHQIPPSPLQTDRASKSPDREHEPLVWWIVAFVSIFQTLDSISDQAIEWLVKFIGVLLHFLVCYSPRLQRVAGAFPNTLYLRDKFIRGSTDLKHSQQNNG